MTALKRYKSFLELKKILLLPQEVVPDVFSFRSRMRLWPSGKSPRRRSVVNRPTKRKKLFVCRKASRPKVLDSRFSSVSLPRHARKTQGWFHSCSALRELKRGREVSSTEIVLRSEKVGTHAFDASNFICSVYKTRTFKRFEVFKEFNAFFYGRSFKSKNKSRFRMRDRKLSHFLSD